MNIKDVVDEFLNYLVAERGLSRHTAAAYGNDLRRFLLKGPMTVEELTTQLLFQHLSSLRAKGYKEASRARALITLKVFCRYLYKEGYLAEDLGERLSGSQVGRHVPTLLSIEEVKALVQAACQDRRYGLRNRAIVELLYSCGLRVSELCYLNLYDVGDNGVRVRGKGGKERLVPIGAPAVAAVDRYLATARGACIEDSPPLFLGDNGQRIDRIAVWQIIKDSAKRAKIDKDISPHTLRHAYATHLLDNGADIRVIQELLGHADISTTDRYMHLSRSHVKRLFEQCHPHNP